MYTIVTGYYGKDAYTADFFEIWWENTHRFSEPKDIFVINVNSDSCPEEKWGKWIDLSYNLGHVHDLDVNDYPNKKFCGWSMSFIMGAYLAYSNNTDFIYKEQDCLAFGDWVDELYSHDKEIVVGQSIHADGQALEQSLFLVRHSAILDFVNAYTNFGGNDAGRGYIRPESKFAKVLNQSFSNRFAFTKMGYGRSKPKNFQESIDQGETFYIQKLTPEEIQICL
jgi:hypothetical protein